MLISDLSYADLKELFSDLENKKHKARKRITELEAYSGRGYKVQIQNSQKYIRELSTKQALILKELSLRRNNIVWA